MIHGVWWVVVFGVVRKLSFTKRLSLCFADDRHQRRVEHRAEEMLRQLVFSLALGYQDLNGQEPLKKDLMLCLQARVC